MFTLHLDTRDIEREAERRNVSAGHVLAERLRAAADYAAEHIRILPLSAEWNTETHHAAPGVTFTLTAPITPTTR